MILVFPTFKASTRHGYKTVLSNHVLPAWQTWRLRDIERPIIHAGKVMRAKLIEPLLLLRVMHTGGCKCRAPEEQRAIILLLGRDTSMARTPLD